MHEPEQQHEKASHSRPTGEQKAETVVQGSTTPSAAQPVDSFDFLTPAQDGNGLGWLAHYRVVRLLGSGGMGLVFQAEDAQLHRPVALKVVRPDLARDELLRQRFLREARAMAAVKSDYIVTVHQVGQADDVPFLAMEFLEGESLDAWLAQGNQPDIATVLRLGREIALGLAAAHERGLIHRDIKPGNVFLEARTGRVKILDFGLARPAHEHSGITQAGLILGTPDYMAPEQADGSAVSERSDLFSLGCVLYRLLAGKNAFAGGSTMAVLKAVALTEPPPLREVNPSVPQRLAVLVSRLLAKDPAERPTSAQETADILGAIAAQPAVAAPAAPAPPGPPAGRRSRGSRAAWLGLTALALAAVCLGAYILGRPAHSWLVASADGTGHTAPSIPPSTRMVHEPLTPDPTDSGQTLNGGGSTFIYPLMEKWGAVYKKEKGVKVNYVATGSGAGIQQLTALALDFCCSDAPLTAAQLKQAQEAGGDVIHVPLALGGIVPAYNLEGIDKPLRFSGPVLADIFRGNIRRWNDAALKELNPGVALPDQEIVVVHRADGSGSTYIFTEFLSKVSKDWDNQVGAGFSVKWPVGVGVRGNEGMLEAVAAKPGAIAYLELLYALRGKVRFGAVKNKAGNYLLGSLETVTAAAEAADAAATGASPDRGLSLTYAPGKDAYPICGCAWAIMYVKQPSGRGQRLVEFLRWLTQDGQEYNTDLYYARLPKTLADRAEQKLKAIQIGE